VENGFSYTWSLLHKDRYRFPVEYLDHMGSVILEGKSHPAPMPVERFLAEHRYGPDFMTPRRVSPNLGWIPSAALSPEVEDALEELRGTEYRVECLQARQKGMQHSRGRQIPGFVVRVHRALWKAKQAFAGARNSVLLEVRYELFRRRRTLRLLESRAKNPS
jgi:hypothetical protein